MGRGARDVVGRFQMSDPLVLVAVTTSLFLAIWIIMGARR
jgi:hypothetical protein